MLGSKDKKPQIVGAKEKLRRAEELKRSMQADNIKARGSKKQDITAAVILIYGMSVTLALLLTMGPLSKGGVGFTLPHPYLNRLLLGSNPPALYGDADIDMVLVSIIRGTVLFCFAGIVPFVAKLWNRLRDNIHGNVYVTVWGTSIALPFLFFFVKDFFGPLVMEVVSIFM